MSIEALTALISAAVGGIGWLLSIVLRVTSGQFKELRRLREENRVLRAQQDACEPYIFRLRKGIRQLGGQPPRWPRRLEFMAKTNEAPEREDDDREGGEDDP